MITLKLTRRSSAAALAAGALALGAMGVGGTVIAAPANAAGGSYCVNPPASSLTVGNTSYTVNLTGNLPSGCSVTVRVRITYPGTSYAPQPHYVDREWNYSGVGTRTQQVITQQDYNNGVRYTAMIE